jgi:uncharacterized short protein YbdD (DUF466 family)
MGRSGGLWGRIRWYVASLMGDNHYQRYVAHRRRTHPGEPVITEAEYWRMRHRDADLNPGARCC